MLMAPDVTITTVGYNVSSGAFTISGTGFDTINRPSDDDVVGQLDWSKFVWDIDGAGSGGVTFEASDFQSAIVSGNTITALLTPTKKTALEGEAGYGFDDVGGSTTTTNAADNIDITAGFIRDDGLNAATGDGAADEAIVWSDNSPASIDSFQGDANSVDGSGNPISLVYGLLDGDGSGANQIGITATMSEKVLAGSSLTVTFGTGGTAVLTADTSDATGLTMSGIYTVREGDDTTSLNITGVEVTSGGNVYDAYGNAMTSPAIPNGENLADNSDIEIDALAPDVTITTVGYNVSSGAFTISGTGFDTINRPSDDDVVGQLDWSKFVWDIDGAGSGGVTFEASDFQSAIVSGNTITALLTPTKKTAS